ncbi:MAG: GGDEF domain-containing protein [Desulfobacter sp.]|nr:MAG: GGDEF domain-containing protein [Desulfobacter sp.]
MAALVWLLVFSSGRAFGMPPLYLGDNTPAYELAPLVEILEDPGDTLTLEDIRKNSHLPFQPNPNNVISIGRSRSAFWFRFNLVPAGSPGEKWLLKVGKQGIGALDLFVPLASPDGGIRYEKIQFGTWRPPPENQIPSRMSVVALPPQWHGPSYFYLKVKSDMSINFPLRIMSAEGYINGIIPDLYGFGILFGILLGMILYNLSIYLFLRDTTYLLYVLYISSMFCYLTMLYGHFEMVFDPDPDQMRILFFAASGITWFFAGAFSRLFLNTKTHAPVFDKIILVMVGSSLLAALSAFAGFTYIAHRLNALLGMVCPPMAILAALRVWQKKFAPAKYFLAAWSVLVTGIVLYSMGGILIPRTPVTVYTFAAGAGVEAILLSLALADRIRLLQNEKKDLEKRQERFRHEAITDGMTGLYNRRFLMETLDRDIRLARDSRAPLSLIMLDVDNFKHFNDTYGHPEGDKVLTALADVMFRHVRKKDCPCRYGGEEFAVVLPFTGETDARGVAERIRTAFSCIVFKPGGANVNATVSIGLAQLDKTENAQALIRRADTALYRAKHQGKNRVVTLPGLES